MRVDLFNIDIEPTNRCNAHCYFCPRDQTPHQGLMTPLVFERALGRSVDFADLARERFHSRIKVNLCGLGEPLLNRHTVDFVRQVREADFECSLSTNASLLDEKRSVALLEAGLQGIEINVGEEGHDYEHIYGLAFEKTCRNVERFAALAGDQCQVRVVLVNHRRDPAHMKKMIRFWRDRGIRHFLPFDVMNRGGALFVDEMQYESYPERATAEKMFAERGAQPVCSAPFLLLFIGYDGNYYLCCSDWKKEVALGNVFDTDFLAITSAKLDRVTSREPICKSCNHDPVNRLTDKLRSVAEGTDTGKTSVEQLAEELVNGDRVVRAIAAELTALAPTRRGGAARRAIPVQVVADT